MDGRESIQHSSLLRYSNNYDRKSFILQAPEMSRLSFYDCTFQSKLAGQILQKFFAVIYATVAVNPCNLRIKSFITYAPKVEMCCIFFPRQIS